MPSSGIPGSYSSSIFNFWRTRHTVLHRALSIYIPINSSREFPFSTPSPAFIVHRFFFFNDGHSDGCEWYLIIVLIFTSLIINDAEHLFRCLLALCMPSLEKCLFRSSTHFLIGLFVFFVFFFFTWTVCMFWRLIPWQLLHLPVFFPILREKILADISLFVLFMVSFAAQNLLSSIVAQQ